MAVRLKPIHKQVIVITGASSGIGLATARRAAEEGAQVVLNSRNGEALAQIERDIRNDGGEAIVCVGDVSNRADMERLADTASRRYGGFDTWVNNAGLSIFGRLDEVDDADHRRLFDINFWGVVNGSLVAVPQLRHRGGALINVGSVLSDIAVPIQGMYSATKHAVKGFTDALRLELEEEGAPISVTLIKPSAIDTPFTQHAKNYTDREPKLPPPVYRPEEVAKSILHAAAHPERDLFVGGAGRMMSFMNRQAPRTMDWLSEQIMVDQQKRREPSRHRQGALYQAGEDGHERGDHPGYVMQTSLYSRATRNPLVAGALVAAAGVAAAALISSSEGRA